MRRSTRAGRATPSAGELQAVLFDTDGVVTDTARAHAAAWQRLFDDFLQQRAERCGEAFRPFDPRNDYLRYVDGKPRMEGVASFLASRGIDLPYGSEDDAPSHETVCGLGNQKNQYFGEWLETNRVHAYPGTLRLIADLRTAGVRTAVFSASRNAEAVLRSAGVLDLFDARVDGRDLAKLGLRGKPDPAMLLEAAARLGAAPARTAVIEDAIAGVKAAVRGAFGQVIAVARSGSADELKAAGAQLVVHDLSEIRFTPEQGLALKTLANLPSVWDREQEIRQQLAGSAAAVFLDYDGTLTPIVEDHTQALLAGDMRAAVAELARHCPVTIVSGRGLDRLRELVQLDSVWYAGSHGFEIAAPGASGENMEKGTEFLPELDAAEHELRQRLTGIEGHAVERKRFSIAVHYRKVAQDGVARVRAIVDQTLAEHPRLRLGHGKKVFEIRPDLDWSKGEAVLWLLQRFGREQPGIVPVYVGDDITDEDAFQALAGRGLCIAVRHEEARATAADYAVADTREVKRLLQMLSSISPKCAANAWSLVYEHYEPRQEGQREALCTLGNGYFASRGATPDAPAGDTHYPGTYLAGGYNRLTSEVGGRRVENEDLVNLPNWLPLTFRIDDGPWFGLDEVELLSFRQELDLRCGMLRRELRLRDAQGRTTRWRERRIVSMADPHLAALSVELQAEDWSGRMTVRSALDGGVTNRGVARYRDLADRHLEVLELEHRGADTIFLRCRTNQSLLMIAQAARTRLYRNGAEAEADVDVERQTHVHEAQIAQELCCAVEAGTPVVVEKVVALHTSRDRAISEAGLEALRTLGRAGRFDELLAAHALAWKHLWEACDIELDGGAAPQTELKLRVHMFHLLQTASPHTIDLDAGVPARGWHGEAYRGHIFWDELFIFPFLSLRLPMLTRALLRYRDRRLPEARRAAQEAGLRGAMYPWQSGSDGREETQRLHLNPRSGRWLPDNTHRQRHINSAIAYNIWQYHQVSHDHEFLYLHGAEMLLEIARFWASAAAWNPALGRYEIKGVMGPDEYHTAYPGTDPEHAGGIDNSAYTNVMAAWVLTRARDVIELLPGMRRAQLCESMGLAADELEHWQEISRKLRVPFHGDGIISQFDGYDELEEFDWKGYEAKYGDIHRLDRILEAEGDTPNRYKVSKQADVLMLFYLFSADELALLFEQLGYPFGHDTIPKNVDYYLARTSHGSTLSQLVHSWVLARSDRTRSWHLFRRSLDSDIADIQGGTTPEGIHVGAMAGTVDLVQRCYLGIEMRANVLHFDPALPAELSRIRVRLHYRRQTLDIDADHESLRIRSGPFTTTPITIAYRGHYRSVAPGDRCEFLLLKPEERDRDENRDRRVTGKPA